MRVLVINGPNLNLLGSREPEVYGPTTLAELERAAVQWGLEMGATVDTFQSNHEGELVDTMHSSAYDGIVLNPGALGHTSRALADAVASLPTPVVEVHISNIREREAWRAESVISGSCVRTIYGRGIEGYRDAIRHLLNRAAMPFDTVRYGPHSENVGDLRRGEEGAAVLVHGGFWRQEWERDHMESIAVDLTNRGWSTWNVEYRRIGLGGGWPGSAHDVLTAIDFVPQLGLGDVPLTVIGFSAGGYLAVWAAQRAASAVARVVALAPVTDLQLLVDSRRAGAFEARTLLDSGAPRSLSPGAVEIVLVHGEGDRLVPIEHSVDFAGRHDLELIRLATGHFELLDPERESWPQIVAVMDRVI